MGLLVNGLWKDQWYSTKETGGKFVRQDAGFRNWVTDDGSAGPSGAAGFKAQSGRYHLYISHACPWANRTAIFRNLKGLQDHIGISVVHSFMGDEGWTFQLEEDATGDTENGFDFSVLVEEPIQPTDPATMTQEVNDRLEHQIRQHMDQWFWIHRRWKDGIGPMADRGAKQLVEMQRKSGG